jgi:hypothetical protein
MVGRIIYRLIQLGQGIGNWWDSLDKQSRELIELVGALTATWWLLNRAMLASPITWVLGLVAAIALLWEDYQTWKEAGKAWLTGVNGSQRLMQQLRWLVI